MDKKTNEMIYQAFGTLFYDDGLIYLADRNTPRVAVVTVYDIVREGQINLS